MTARDEFEARCRSSGSRSGGRRRESHPKRLGCMAHTAWVTCDGRAVSSISLRARLTFATPRDRVVEARSRLV